MKEIIDNYLDRIEKKRNVIVKKRHSTSSVSVMLSIVTNGCIRSIQQQVSQSALPDVYANKLYHQVETVPGKPAPG